MHTSSLERCRKQEEESPPPSSTSRRSRHRYTKAHSTHSTHSAPGLSLTPSESLTGMGRRQRADRGAGGLGPHQKAKDPSPQQTNPRALPSQPSRDSTGPLVGPSRSRFHWATRSTMTWRHAGLGLGSSGGVGGLTCLAASTSCPSAPVPFRGSNADRAGGFAAAALLAALCSPPVPLDA